MRALRVLILVAACCCAACSDDAASSRCVHRLHDGTCVGVTQLEICGGDFCTDGASCKTTYFVKAGAGGSGSKANPFGTLDEAAQKATSGDCIALGKGSYTSTVIPGGVSLLGSGAKHVTLGGPALMVSTGKGGLLRGFAVATAGYGLAIKDVQDLSVKQVLFESAAGVAIDSRGVKDLHLEHVEVQKVIKLAGAGSDAGPDSTPTPDSMPLDAGVPDLQQPDLQQPDAGSTDAMPVDAGPTPDQSAPQPDTAVTPDAMSADVAPAVPDAGSGSDDKDYGVAILVADNATATIERCAVAKAGTQGILIHTSSATITQTRITGSGKYGVAIDCTTGCGAVAASEVTGCLIDDNKDIGLLVLGGEVTAQDNDINQTSYRKYGRNVQCQGGAQLTFQGNRVHDSEGQGIVVDACTGALTSNRVDGNADRGIVLQHVTSLTLDGNELDGNDRAGIAAISSTGVTITGGRISNTVERAVIIGSKHGMVGDGLQVLVGSVVSVSTVKLEANQRVGVLIDDAKGTVEDTTITGSKQAVVVQNAALADQKLTRVKDANGTDISAHRPQVPFVNNSTELVGIVPLPLP